jgi:acyl-coenzyme A thioesterase PaaI-like protein
MNEPDLKSLSDLTPFAAAVGMELLEATPELVVSRLQWTPERCTTGGVMHGGALMALADNGGGVRAFLNLPGAPLAPRRSSRRRTSCGRFARGR